MFTGFFSLFSVIVCAVVEVGEHALVCRLTASCAGHVEEEVSGGQKLAAAGGGRRSPVLCLEAKTLGATFTHHSQLPVLVGRFL